MPELALIGFKNDRSRAAAVLHALRETEEPWTADLRTATAVHRDAHGTLVEDRSYEPSRTSLVIVRGLEGAIIGLMLAVIMLPFVSCSATSWLGGALLVSGLVAAVVEVRRGAAPMLWIELVIPSELQRMVLRNDSAICIRWPVTDHAELVERFCWLQGTVLSPRSNESLECRRVDLPVVVGRTGASREEQLATVFTNAGLEIVRARNGNRAGA